MHGDREVRPNVWTQLKTNLKARVRLRKLQKSKARNLRLKYVSFEQLAYADLLDLGVKIGRIVLICTFVIYAFGLIPPKIPLSDLPAYWSMPADQYSRAVGVGRGLSWLKLVGYADYMNFVGIAFLTGLTAFCYVRILPFPFSRKDFLFVAILVLELIILVLAASGLLTFGNWR